MGTNIDRPSSSQSDRGKPIEVEQKHDMPTGSVPIIAESVDELSVFGGSFGGTFGLDAQYALPRKTHDQLEEDN